MENFKIAVIGLGPAGMTSLKCLLEEGFDVQGFERRDRVGGVWAYSHCSHYTSVIPETVSNVSKFLSGFSDFPVPEDWPVYMTGRQVAEYFDAYAKHFQLKPHIKFRTTVLKVVRDELDRGWNIHTNGPDGNEVLNFDKVVFGNGSDTIPMWPPLPGKEKFQGSVIHGQQFREPEQFTGKKVMIVGIGNTACEIALSLIGHASKVYQSYRRGRIVLSRFYDNGHPSDIAGPWPSMRLQDFVHHQFPWLSRRLADRRNQRQMISDTARLDPALQRSGLSDRRKKKLAEDRIRHKWHLLPCASTSHVHPVVQEHWIPAISSEQIIPVSGFQSFQDDRHILLTDGSSIEVDVIVFCTGYSLDFTIFPDLEMNGASGIPVSTASTASDQQQPSLPRLFQMIFPPRWASSIAFLSWMSVLDTAWCTCELASMAVTQAWAADCAQKLGLANGRQDCRAPALLPSENAMNAEVNKYHDWWRKQWLKEPSFHPGYTRPHSFIKFLHKTAGTGIYDELGHPLIIRSWALLWKDRPLHTWLTKGPANSHAFRLFETNPAGVPGCGRQTWPGARRAVESEFYQYEAFKRDMKDKALRQQVLMSIPKGR